MNSHINSITYIVYHSYSSSTTTLFRSDYHWNAYLFVPAPSIIRRIPSYHEPTAAKAKHVKRGVKEVVKGLRKGEKGLVLIAGDISPIDVITHVPVLCEENDVPYVFLPSKEELGTAGSTKRPTSCVMVVLGGKKKDMDGAKDYKELYDECFAKVKEMVCVTHPLNLSLSFLLMLHSSFR